MDIFLLNRIQLKLILKEYAVGDVTDRLYRQAVTAAAWDV